MVARVKKNDTVVILQGKDKGKKGTVIDLDLNHDTVMVKGINVVTRHVKARKQGETSGIKKEEKYINMSNVMPVCASCSKPCRVNVAELEGGKRARACNKCKEIF